MSVERAEKWRFGTTVGADLEQGQFLEGADSGRVIKLSHRLRRGSQSGWALCTDPALVDPWISDLQISYFRPIPEPAPSESKESDHAE